MISLLSSTKPTLIDKGWERQNGYNFSRIVVGHLPADPCEWAVEAENLAAALKPASPAVPTTTADKQHYDYDDQKSCGVHTILLIADERDRGPCNPKNQRGPSLVPEAAN